MAICSASNYCRLTTAGMGNLWPSRGGGAQLPSAPVSVANIDATVKDGKVERRGDKLCCTAEGLRCKAYEAFVLICLPKAYTEVWRCLALFEHLF